MIITYKPYRAFLPLFASAALLICTAPQTALADNVQTTSENLLARVQIEDLISNYYWDMESSGRESLSDYYVDDAVLDVNGKVFKGPKEIQSAYASSSIPSGKFNMLMNNPKIRVHGNTATADVIWTGVLSDTVRVPPRFIEQGREHDELVNKNGKWYFKKRMITSDGGLPESYDATYKKR